MNTVCEVVLGMSSAVGVDAAAVYGALVFAFGKYKGTTMAEVFCMNPAYFIFLQGIANPAYETRPSNRAIAYFAAQASTIIKEQNAKDSKGFAGTVGESIVVELTIASHKKTLTPFRDQFNRLTETIHNRYTATDAEGRLFSFKLTDLRTDKMGGVWAVGAVVKVKAKVEGHNEWMGKEYTHLAYLKAAK